MTCVSFHKSVTVILFIVNVPVLSEAITVADPSASTTSRRFKYTFFVARRRVTIVSCDVTVAGSP
jgi:hypothetical protein